MSVLDSRSVSSSGYCFTFSSLSIKACSCCLTSLISFRTVASLDYTTERDRYKRHFTTAKRKKRVTCAVLGNTLTRSSKETLLICSPGQLGSLTIGFLLAGESSSPSSSPLNHVSSQEFFRLLNSDSKMAIEQRGKKKMTLMMYRLSFVHFSQVCQCLIRRKTSQ